MTNRNLYKAIEKLLNDKKEESLPTLDHKIGKLTHQRLGQMQMYINYFDRFMKLPDEVTF